MRLVALLCVLFVIILVVNAQKELHTKYVINKSNKFAGYNKRPAVLVPRKLCGTIMGYNKATCAKKCLSKGYTNSSCNYLKRCTCLDERGIPKTSIYY